MTSEQVRPLIASAVRHGLTLLAGYLVARGAVSPTTASGFVEGLSGIVVGLIGLTWSAMRAGRLGEQAKTIASLIDALGSSIPADAAGVLVPHYSSASAPSYSTQFRENDPTIQENDPTARDSARLQDTDAAIQENNPTARNPAPSTDWQSGPDSIPVPPPATTVNAGSQADGGTLVAGGNHWPLGSPRIVTGPPIDKES